MLIVGPSVFSRFTLVKSQTLTEPTNGKTVAEERVKHRVGGPAKRTEKGRKVAKVALKENDGSIKNVIALTMLPDAEERLGKSVSFTSTRIKNEKDL